MRHARFRSIAFAAAAVSALLGATVVEAQTDAASAATSTAASTAKETSAQRKAERKAQRKAARAKKNAELKTLEKNGYQPGGSSTRYPDDLQNAQKKAAGANAAPASAP